MRKRTGARLAASSVAVIALAAACGGGSSGAGSGPTISPTVTSSDVGTSSAACSNDSTNNQASDTGVSTDSIKVGYEQDITGALSSAFVKGLDGFQSAIDQANANGGICGRKIQVVVEDTATNPATALTVSQKLVEQDKVFAIAEESGVFSGAYRYLQAQKIPVVSGHPIDGNEWSDPTNGTMIEGDGAPSPTKPNTPLANLIKSQGGMKLAIISYNQPTSVALAETLKKAAPLVGMKVVYLNEALPLPATGLPAIAQQVKDSGANALATPLSLTDDLALIAAVKQAGANIKVPLLWGQYGAALTDDPTTAAAANGGLSINQWWPVEANNAATKAFQAAISQYAHYTGAPTGGMYYGWATGTLLVHGLELAGQNPTRQSFLDGLHGDKAWSVNGLAAPVNLAQSLQGTYISGNSGNCIYGARLNNAAFTNVSSNPFCAN